MRHAILLITLLITFFACGDSPTSTNSSTTEKQKNSDSGLSMMQDSIRQILKNANSVESIYENEIRAKHFKSRFESTKKLADLFNYVKELLNNGETDLAITTIDNLFASNTQLKTITEQTKLVHEMLAICYLRKGEQENCQDNHNDESCIIPISKNGQHQKKSGSEQAIKKYLELLKVYPEDTQSQWLLNIAYMTLGQYPSKVPKEYLVPIGRKSPNSTLNNVATKMGLDFFGLAGGCIADDFNNDGHYDIVTSSWGSQGKMKYFQNDGNGSFIDKTDESKIGKSKGGLHINQTDYNNDGYLDILILRSAWMPQQDWGILPNSLLKNNGDGSFSDVTIEAGIYSTRPTQAACWRDFNNDGFLDLFIANETTHNARKKFPCEFYLNKGDGSFEEVSGKYGLDKVGYFKGCASADVNKDGWQDLYLSNLDGENTLLLGENQNGEFSGFTKSTSNLSLPFESFACWFFDINNDGWEDLYVNSYDRTAFDDQGGQFASNILSKPVKTENSALYVNQGNGKFKNAIGSLIKEKGISTMGCNYGDMNNDGFLDFYLGTGAPEYRAIVPNRLYVNKEGKSFKDESFALGVGHIQKGHGISFADFDNDGDQDIYAVMGGAFKGDGFPNALFENSDNKNNWLKLKLKGTQSNAVAIGALIEVIGKSKSGQTLKIYKTVSSGASFGANPFTAEIGLGQMSEITSVNIAWPNGSTEAVSYSGIALNKKYLIEEGSQPKELELKTAGFRKDKEGHHHHHH